MRMHYAIEHERKIQPRFSIRNYKYRRQDDKKEPRQSELGTRRAIFGPGGPVSSILLSLGRARLPRHFSSPTFQKSRFRKCKKGEKGEYRLIYSLAHGALKCVTRIG